MADLLHRAIDPVRPCRTDLEKALVAELVDALP